MKLAVALVLAGLAAPVFAQDTPASVVPGTQQFEMKVLATGLDSLQHRSQFNSDNLLEVAVFYAIFMLVDLAASTIAFAMEKREKWSLLWWLVLQRFGYRQLMYYVVIRSVSAALRGPSVGWGRHERKGIVRSARTAVLVVDSVGSCAGP